MYEHLGKTALGSFNHPHQAVIREVVGNERDRVFWCKINLQDREIWHCEEIEDGRDVGGIGWTYFKRMQVRQGYRFGILWEDEPGVIA